MTMNPAPDNKNDESEEEVYIPLYTRKSTDIYAVMA